MSSLYSDTQYPQTFMNTLYSDTQYAQTFWILHDIQYPQTFMNTLYSDTRMSVYTHPTGWLWLVASIKLQVSFAKEPYKRDDILQKIPII